VIAIALATYLDSLDIVDYQEADGGDCFIHHLPDQPDEAVMVTAYGANPVEGATALGYDEPTLQVHVRSTTDPAPGEARAQDVYGELQGLSHVTMAEGTGHETRVIECRCPQTGPVYLGRDQKGRHEYVVNVALHIRNLTAYRE
jgi:hypothetical protein